MIIIMITVNWYNLGVLYLVFNMAVDVDLVDDWVWHNAVSTTSSIGAVCLGSCPSLCLLEKWQHVLRVENG